MRGATLHSASASKLTAYRYPYRGIALARARLRARLQHSRNVLVPKIFCLLRKIGLSALPCRSFLPPTLHRKPTRVPAGHLWGKLPVTQYIGDAGLQKGNVRSGRSLDIPSEGVPEWFTLFDWVVGVHFGFTKGIREPGSVWVHGTNFSSFMRWIDEQTARGAIDIGLDAFLVVGGRDDRPAQYETWATSRAKEIFSRVFFEANDGVDPGISTYPTAISESYFRGHEPVIESLLYKPPPKGQLLLASWGAKWPSLNKRLADRSEALRFLESTTLADLQILSTPEYLRTLASSHYMLYPRGQGIQSPKGFEAWLFKTIPVVTWHPVFAELKTKGAPLLIVDSWSDVTEELLVGSLPSLTEQMEAFHPLTLDAKAWWEYCFGAKTISGQESNNSDH